MTTGAERDPAQEWFVRLPPQHDAAVQVIGFPTAGNGCGQFGPLARAAAGRLDVWAANLPGRHARFGEPPYTTYAPLIDELVPALRKSLDGRPYALLGYCSGALLAYGVTRALLAEGAPPPATLVCVAYPAPRDGMHTDLSGLSSPAFWDYVVQAGGVPKELDVEAHRPLFEPALRADYAVLADYRHTEHEPFPTTRILGVLGDEEPQWLRRDMTGWARVTGAGFRMKELTGGHWLLHESTEAFTELLVHELSGASGELSGASGA